MKIPLEFLEDAIHWARSEKIKKIFIYSYIQLSIIFVIAIFLKEMGFMPSYFLNFILFGYLLPIFALPLILEIKDPPLEIKIKPVYIYFFIIIVFIFTFAIRMMPYSGNSIPLGYDPGYYKYTIDLYLDNLPGIPENTLPIWIKQMHEQGFFVLFNILHIFTDISSTQALLYLFPIFCTFLVLPLFILTRKVFDDKVALLATALYAVSYTQFTAFTFMYLRNILGLIFLLFSLYALEKKKYALMSIFFAALGIYHRPEFLIFALILASCFLVKRDKALIYPTVLTAILIAPFWLPRLEIYLSMVMGISNTMLQSILGEPSGSGTFYDFGNYEWVSLAYLPFAIIGAVYLTLRKKWNSLLFYFLINGLIVFFKLFFYNRLIIDLDMVLLILAPAGILYTFRRMPYKAGIILILLLVVSSAAVTLQKVHDAKPLINDNQLEAIKWLSQNTEEDSFVLATSQDAPWALAWSARRVIAPGLFEWDDTGRDEWLEFLASDDPEIAEEFLNKYNSKIYIYYSFNRFNWMNLEKFNSTVFTKIPMRGAVIYRYDGTE